MITAQELKNQCHGLSVLYVEDDDDIRSYTVNLLENFFTRIEVAENGAIGWEKFQSHSFDFVITDIRMPEMDGIELSQLIKKKNFNFPILVISAHDEAQYLTELINIGVANFLAKPLDIQQFLSILHRLVSRIQLEKEKEALVQEREKYTLMLQKLNQDKDLFFSIISHDLKSPFNGILGLTELLASPDFSPPPDEARLIAAEINNASKKYYQLLLNLLDWSRLQRGKMEYRPEVVNLNSLVTLVIGQLSQFARQKEITLQNQTEQNLLLKIDKEMTRTAIHNLLSNAIKYSTRGGRVSISTSITPENWVELEVKDFGVGMSAKDASKLFQIEHKNSTPGTEDEMGTGLGLHLCKEMVEKQGGKIRAESVLGQGSSFFISFMQV